MVLTDLSVDMDSLAPKDFLGNGGSWQSTGTVKTRGWARGALQNMEDAGRSLDRWRCGAWVARCAGRRCGTWPGGWAGDYIRCVLARAQGVALGAKRNKRVRTGHCTWRQNRGDIWYFHLVICWWYKLLPWGTALPQFLLPVVLEGSISTQVVSMWVMPFLLATCILSRKSQRSMTKFRERSALQRACLFTPTLAMAKAILTLGLWETWLFASFFNSANTVF